MLQELLSHYFQLGPVPSDQMIGSYDMRIVMLSYLVACFASYIALDITGRLRDINNTPLTTTLWIIGGSLAMGAGIWSMHFIGMLAFTMDMPFSYQPSLTVLSMLVAMCASMFALLILKARVIHITQDRIGRRYFRFCDCCYALYGYGSDAQHGNTLFAQYVHCLNRDSDFSI